VLFPFFSGLLAEGNLKDLQCRLYRIDPNDDFTRLLKTTRYDVIGAVTVEEVVS
jgi:serine/threonine-protein kinase HipA